MVTVLPRTLGSSPLARGARTERVEQDRAGRIIPAHAGSTHVCSSVMSKVADHPRSRGEHPQRGTDGRGECGSSPLTRGARRMIGIERCPVGIIPAHAGSTHGRGSPSGSNSDHPRSRGEHWTCPRGTGCVSGSSPLTRGARGPRRCVTSGSRIIPAHAGSTCPRPQYRSIPADHPRSRGEHDAGGVNSSTPGGSSPLTRGALTAHAPRGVQEGIIPAHAGSTDGEQMTHGDLPDHPRSRGEHNAVCCRTRTCCGSSPLTRGAHGVGDGGQGGAGIIPAHAGSTVTMAEWVNLAKDHPRSRGEHTYRASHLTYEGGSSPLTRGARDVSASAGVLSGIIPAHAGSTLCGTAAWSRRRDHPRSRGEHCRYGGG